MGGERLHPAVFIVLAVAFGVLTTPLASWFWAVVTPLHYLAYPWRFLSAVSLSLSVASGALASCRPLLGGDLIRRGVPAAALAALVVWGYVRARPKEFLTFDDEYYAPARIAALGMNTTTREEYEPRWVEVRPAYSPVVAEIAGGRAGIVSSDGSAFDRTVDLVVEEAAAVRLNAFYFPGWEASIDGTTAPIEVSPGDGRMILHVGEGRHTIRVLLRDTIPRMAGRAVSALTALLLAGLWIRSRGASGVDRRAPSGA